MATTGAKRQPSWMAEEDGVYGEDYFDIFVNQMVGRVKVDPNAIHTAVAAAFEVIGKTSPGDNEHHHSSYEFQVPGVGMFKVDVSVTPEGGS